MGRCGAECITHVVLEEPADFPITSRYKGCQERCWGDIVEGHRGGASPRPLKPLASGLGETLGTWMGMKS